MYDYIQHTPVIKRYIDLFAVNNDVKLNKYIRNGSYVLRNNEV